MEACPALLNATESVSVTCQNHHLQLLLGRNVHVTSDAAGEPVVGKRTMTIPSSKGIESKRVIDFSDNILIPYMEGGRLSDIFNTAPRFQSTMLRYPLYVTVATRLVDAVRFLHEHHIAHLAIEPSSIVCSSFDCDEIMLTDFSRSTLGAAISPYANEMMQDSVRFISYEEPLKDEDAEDPSAAPKPNDEVVREFQAYAMEDMKNPNWLGALQVDWYAVGGTFYSILVRTRFAPDAHTGGSITKYLAEYIFKTFEDKKVLERVVRDSDSSDTLKRVRNSVAEGVMLIEGLLNPNRAERISLDKSEDGNDRTERVRRGLRASHALMSSLQLDDKQIQKPKKSTSCASFMEHTVKSSRVLNGITVNDKSHLPNFMQEFC